MRLQCGNNLRSVWLFVLLIFSEWCVAKPPAVDLLHCFADAIANDPIYQAQVAIYNANKQAVPTNYAALLPQVTLSGDIAKEYQYLGQLGKGIFKTNNVGVQATQTVFNYTQYKQLEQARYAVRSAFATLSGQQQDLMLRTTKAYLDVLQGHDLLLFAKEQKKYLVEQLDATKQLFEHNDSTIIDLEQAQGAYDAIESDLYAAEINYYNAIQTLSQITGIRYYRFRYLNPGFPLIRPIPVREDAWVNVANKQNWFLRATRLDIGASREAVGAAQGGFIPNLYATAGMSRAMVPSLLLTDSVGNNINSTGLNATWNVFQGGLTVSQVATAIANMHQAEANMRKQYLQTMADTRRAYMGIIWGRSRVKSIRASLIANTKAINHAQEAYRAGEITITEILQIQYQLYRSQRLYADYIYNYLLDIVLLKQAAGILDVETLALLNSWLEPPSHGKRHGKR